MTESEKTPSHRITFQEHPLYQAALEQLAAGEEKEAVENLGQLAEIYPEEQELAALQVRIELKAALDGAEYKSVERRQPQPFLRQILLILLTVTMALCGITALVALYERYGSELPWGQQGEDPSTQLLSRAQQALEAGNLTEARQFYGELLESVPGHPEAQEALGQIEQQENLNQLYLLALDQRRQGNWQAALDTLNEIQAQWPGYKEDIEFLIKDTQEQLALEEKWQQIPGVVAAEDWPRLIAELVPMHESNPEFHRQEVEGLLFQAYVALAQAQLAQANANPDQLNLAITYLDEALALRPADRNLANERRMAVRFVRGSNHFSQGNAIGAVGEWGWVYASQPDYQGGVLREKLKVAYPQAARDKIARANGSILELNAAVEYLDQALIFHPGDEALIEDRRLVTEYVAGAEAFAKEEWDVAISYWGPINAVRSDFQNGILSKNLREACANSTSPDEEFCSQ